MLNKRRSQSLVRLVLVVCCVLFVSVAQATPFRMLLGVRTPMRDGVTLSSDIWVPKEPGRYPALLVRTPYIKAGGDVANLVAPLATFYVEHGYVVVIQDTRGRGDSDGKFD